MQVINVETSNPTTKTTEMPSASPASYDINMEPMMTSFSVDSTVVFDKVPEPMDDETITIFEQVMTGYLIDATIDADQDHQLFISSVDVIDQVIVEVDDSATRRSLEAKVLQVVIRVIGEVDAEVTESYIANITMMLEEELNDEQNQQELTSRLAKESSFFDTYYEQQNELVVAEAQKGTSEEDTTRPPYVVLIVGICAALAVLVGSMFYMDRRTQNARGQRADGFEPYDLRHGSADDMEAAMLGLHVMKASTPKPVEISRMKSVMDFVEEKVRSA